MTLRREDVFLAAFATGLLVGCAPIAAAPAPAAQSSETPSAEAVVHVDPSAAQRLQLRAGPAGLASLVGFRRAASVETAAPGAHIEVPTTSELELRRRVHQSASLTNTAPAATATGSTALAGGR